MSQAIRQSENPAIGALHEVRAIFDDPDAMQAAVARLELSGFDRADLSLPEAISQSEHATPEAGAKAVDTEEDARQTRTLYTGGAAVAVGMAAAGVVIASGGAAAPAVAAAVMGAGAAGGIAYLLTTASNEGEQEDRERKAASGLLVLSVRASNAEKACRGGGGDDPASGGRHRTGGAVMPTRKDDEKYDQAVEDSFPASDPPANSGIVGPQATRPAPASIPRTGRRQRPEGHAHERAPCRRDGHQEEREEQPPK